MSSSNPNQSDALQEAFDARVSQQITKLSKRLRELASTVQKRENSSNWGRTDTGEISASKTAAWVVHDVMTALYNADLDHIVGVAAEADSNRNSKS